MPAQLTLTLPLQDCTISEGFTQSELSLMDECRLKWNFRYNNLLTRANFFNWNLWVGTAWHNFQEWWRTNDKRLDMDKHCGTEIPKGILRDTAFEEEYEYWTGVLPAYQQMYAMHYREEKSMEWLYIEEQLTAEFMGFKLRGMLDLVSDKYHFIRDFKTTSSAWLLSSNGWHFKLQFMFYCWLMKQNHPVWTSKPFDFQLDILQKPALKQTQADGSLVGHIRRVKADIMKRPEFYFKRETKQILPENIDHFEKHVLTPKIQTIALVMENPDVTECLLANPNTNACNAFGNQCEFFEICEKGWHAGKFFFEQRKAKHEEL
jgi:hypothetical protein